MTILEQVQEVLVWCTVINYVVLIVWFAVFIGAHDWLYQLHHRWFHLSTEHFDAVHYAGMAVYKIGILIFNLVPMVACFLIS
ncbi:hypothetical protein F6A13_01050 [Acidithiobacillus sp. 'AMD consortium']|uniref:Uncharacterized protein n=2 Tax=Acidithiobacillus ferridurans TaxID=1232575 RepID=A0A2Z6IMK8_ACIFI|nr:MULTISPECIES: hypothetical protein [Acidithiobacillus]MBU2715639.1 hypothetical protein [Acidithiobacillus ferridurans]MBU2724651.1 hypothetical protein [Acidithiobacillus ferridurans]MBU2727292.1 hypothetical protein [Acidithiobacillus ferridurans]QFG77373.1 hypothetical protein F6A13_01050 [Acidithiobacillus sp. 'AMD consortium']RBM02355.1 hypothetical protein C3R74_05385 [Acidithiobacillus ferridurans]